MISQNDRNQRYLTIAIVAHTDTHTHIHSHNHLCLDTSCNNILFRGIIKGHYDKYNSETLKYVSKKSNVKTEI